jgi:hypothetical protein
MRRFLVAAAVGASVALVIGFLLRAQRHRGDRRDLTVATAGAPPTAQEGATRSRPSFRPAAPVEMKARSSKPARRMRAPSFVGTSEHSGGSFPQFGDLADAHPEVARAVSSRAMATVSADAGKLRPCARALMARRPEENRGGVAGTLGLTLDVEKGQARVVGVERVEGGDPEFVECMSAAMSWFSEPFPVDSTYEGTVRTLWPYRVGSPPAEAP